jgi:phage terminase large subunit-like protein
MSVVQQNLSTAIEKLKVLERQNCFDAFHPESRPTEKQLTVFKEIADVACRYVVAGNQSGKSQMGAREVSWIFNHQHPYWDTKEQFGETPLLILVIGRVGEQVETELWSRKIKPFLAPGTYKEVRTGSSLQRVIHKENGNTIIFLSHHNVNEAREKAQAFTAAFVWLDEMPKSLSLVIELELRTIANNGKMLTTFTPLIRDPKIKDKIENVQLPVGKKYQFAMLDNPIYVGREAEIAERFKSVPEDERNARLYGEWFKGGMQVYNFDAKNDVVTPAGYHPSWAHIEIIDPAASGKAGLLLLANRPETNEWYAVKGLYIKGVAPTDLLDEVETHTSGYNLIRKICDPHETWYIKEAAKRKRYYSGVYKKNERKHELIKNLGQALNHKIFITEWVPLLIDDLDSCMWAEDRVDKIIGASRFHLLDCAQYGCDNLPKMSETVKPKTWEHELRTANKKRMARKGKLIARKGRRKW